MYRTDKTHESQHQLRQAQAWYYNEQEAREQAQMKKAIMLSSLAVMILSSVAMFYVLMPLADQCVADFTGYFDVSQCVIKGNPALKLFQDIVTSIVYR